MDNSPLTPGCIKHAVRIVGDKWTALLLREFASGPKRFCELERSLSLNPRTLTQRLEHLLDEAIIVADEPAAKRRAYQLTTKGRDLLPALHAMAEWGKHYPEPSRATTPSA